MLTICGQNQDQKGYNDTTQYLFPHTDIQQTAERNSVT